MESMAGRVLVALGVRNGTKVLVSRTVLLYHHSEMGEMAFQACQEFPNHSANCLATVNKN